MSITRILYLLTAVIILLPVYACTETNDGSQKAVFKQQPEIIEIKPQRPVKIKMKRNTSGKYSWDLTGDNAEKVLEVDRKLKKVLGE